MSVDSFRAAGLLNEAIGDISELEITKHSYIGFCRSDKCRIRHSIRSDITNYLYVPTRVWRESNTRECPDCGEVLQTRRPKTYGKR